MDRRTRLTLISAAIGLVVATTTGLSRWEAEAYRVGAVVLIAAALGWAVLAARWRRERRRADTREEGG